LQVVKHDVCFNSLLLRNSLFRCVFLFLSFQEFCIVISVTGVFREPAIIKSPHIRSFSRVFVLVQIGPRAFQIANETMHVKNATSKEAEVSMWYHRYITYCLLQYMVS
jgi:hypothetical protein